ncbi:MAG: hypothetical protein LRY33_00220 [Parabacteroides chartae]|nr:hypothetical protein [Parabacteroides chartae]
MNELKKKRSRFKELIDTYCGANPYNFDLFLANVKKDEYALSVILEIMGYINDPAYFNNKEHISLKQIQKLFPAQVAYHAQGMGQELSLREFHARTE